MAFVFEKQVFSTLQQRTAALCLFFFFILLLEMGFVLLPVSQGEAQIWSQAADRLSSQDFNYPEVTAAQAH